MAGNTGDVPMAGIVAGEDDCRHRRPHRTYLGNMSTLAMYRCDRCGGVLLGSPSTNDDP